MTGGEEFASATALPVTAKKRASSEETRENVRHVRWIQSELPSEEQQEPIYLNVKTDGFLGFEVYNADARPEVPADFSSQPPALQTKPDNIVAIQRDRFMEMGEEVRETDSEPLKTVAHPEKAMRVVWGTPIEPPDADWDLHDHWFGEMKHYEHWLGDPHSAAISIRLDQSAPANDLIPFAELASLFERQALIPSRMAEKLAEFLEQGDQMYVGALKAIATMNSLYSDQNQATVDVNVFERSLVKTKWFCALAAEATWVCRDDIKEVARSEIDPQDDENDDRYMPNSFDDIMQSMRPSSKAQGGSLVTPILHLRQTVPQTLRGTLQPSRMSISQSFSGILFFENSFDIPPSQVSNVMAMSTGNSLFIAASLLCDPAKPPRGSKIRHVMGNVGKPGMALLVPPVQPRMMTLGIDKWHLIDLGWWDGVERDSFEGSTLHLWFTGKNQEVDVGYTGAQDQELYILESVVSLYGKGG